MSSHQYNLVSLFESLSECLSESDLRTLCFYLEVDYEELAGKGKGDRIRELLIYLKRRGRLDDLIRTGKLARPDISWDGFLINEETHIAETRSWLLRRLQETSPIKLIIESRMKNDIFPLRPRVMIYYQDKGLTKSNALDLVAYLDGLGVEGIIAEHVRKTSPDAVFIGSNIRANLVRSVMAQIKYKVSYVFPVDYLDDEYGDLSSFVMGVGLHSVMRKEIRPAKEEPIKLQRGQLNRLIEPGLSDQEFKFRLLQIASAKL